VNNVLTWPPTPPAADGYYIAKCGQFNGEYKGLFKGEITPGGIVGGICVFCFNHSISRADKISPSVFILTCCLSLIVETISKM